MHELTRCSFPGVRCDEELLAMELLNIIITIFFLITAIENVF